MTLMNFDTDLDAKGVVSAVTVVETVAVTHRPSEGRSWLTKPVEQWDWRDLQDYVVHEIETRHGVFPRNSKKEYGIFSSFVSRWGAKAGRIAQYAFDVCEGRWIGAPISVFRFCKNSDPVFAQVIADKLD